jgi:hypothetical protein
MDGRQNWTLVILVGFVFEILIDPCHLFVSRWGFAVSEYFHFNPLSLLVDMSLFVTGSRKTWHNLCKHSDRKQYFL